VGISAASRTGRRIASRRCSCGAGLLPDGAMAGGRSGGARLRPDLPKLGHETLSYRIICYSSNSC